MAKAKTIHVPKVCFFCNKLYTDDVTSDVYCNSTSSKFYNRVMTDVHHTSCSAYSFSQATMDSVLRGEHDFRQELDSQLDKMRQFNRDMNVSVDIRTSK